MKYGGEDDAYDEGLKQGFDNCRELVIEVIQEYKKKNMNFYAVHAQTLIEIIKDKEFPIFNK